MAGSALIAGPVGAQHVHGVIELGVVVEDQAFSVSLRAPLADVIGFEHAPEDDAQAERVSAAVALLTDASAMFGLPEAAGCELQGVSIDGPDFIRDSIAADEHHDHDDGNGHDDDHDHEHESDHDHDGDHDHGADDAHDDHDHDGESHGSHADIDAEYLWECATPSALGTLEIPFVEQFQGLEEIQVQILSGSETRYFETDGQVDSIVISER